MITKFERLRAGDKFVSVTHGPQDVLGKNVWIKKTENVAVDKDGSPRKFEKSDSVLKLKKTASIPPTAHCTGGEA